MFYVYIIYSKKLNKFYTGYTEDVQRRLDEHNRGIVPFTSKGIPWEPAYHSAFVYKQDALDEEKFLKSGKGRERRKYLLNKYIENLKINTKGGIA